MIKLKALVEHTNEFGDAALKKVGATYGASPHAAQGLIANGYAEDVDGVLKNAAPVRAKKEG